MGIMKGISKSNKLISLLVNLPFSLLLFGCGSDFVSDAGERLMGSKVDFFCEGPSTVVCETNQLAHWVSVKEGTCVGPNLYQWSACKKKCTDGLQLINDECVDTSCWGSSQNKKECEIKDSNNQTIGKGEQVLLCENGKANNNYGSCTPLQCFNDLGYHLVNGQCSLGTCDDTKRTKTQQDANNHGTCTSTANSCDPISQTWTQWGSWSCICDSGYEGNSQNGTCDKVVCQGNGTESCSVTDGTGLITHTCNDETGQWSSGDSCKITSCTFGYKPNADGQLRCDPILCPNEGQGGEEKECKDSFTGGQQGIGVQQLTCYRSENPDSYWVTNGNCQIQSCVDNKNFTVVDNKCVPKECPEQDFSCTIAYGKGEKDHQCVDGQWEVGTQCKVKSCDLYQGQPAFYPNGSNTACLAAQSCKELKDKGWQALNGQYYIRKGTENSLIKVKCESGWTGINSDQAFGELGGRNSFSCINPPDKEEWVLPTNLTVPIPRTRNGVGQKHSCSVVFQVPFSYSSFRLLSPASQIPYIARSYCGGTAKADIDKNEFQQQSFATPAFGKYKGDISFGPPQKLVTSFAREHAPIRLSSETELSWTANKDFTNFDSATQFRIDWGEQGDANEGWYPWYSGLIWFK